MKPAQKNKILIVNDETNLLKFYKRFIKSVLPNRDILTAENAEIAIGIIKNEPHLFLLIITDWKMPKINGIEMIRIMRSHSIKTPAIIISGNYEAIKLQNKEELNILAILSSLDTSTLRELAVKHA